MKILFYTSAPRAFKSSLIGNLYEISQVFSVVLVSEKLDSNTEKFLNNKNLFPKLEEIIPINQYLKKSKSIFLNLLLTNRELCHSAKSIIKKYKPEIVIVENDLTIFEMYLLRSAKKVNAKTFCFQSGIRFETNKLASWVYLMGAKNNFPNFIPGFLRIFLEKIRRRISHFFYYWILPMMVFQKPFLGKSSVFLWKWVSGLRDADYSIVFSQRDRDISIESGVPAKKIYILGHPINGVEAKKFFKVFYPQINLKKHKKNKIVLIALPNKTSAVKDDLSVISADLVREGEINIIKKIVEELAGWEIYVKPHPAISDLEYVTGRINELSRKINILDHDDVFDRYIGEADLIIGLSPSTVLYAASLQFPEKPILSLNFDKDFRGKLYKDFESIEYIETEEELIKFIGLIKNGTYQKMKVNNNLSDTKDILGSAELLINILNK